MVVDVELGDHHLAVQFVRNFLERRADHLARTAPFGPEIDEDRRVAVEHIGLETVVDDRFGTHHLTPDRKSTRLNSSHYCSSRIPSSARQKQHSSMQLTTTIYY